MATDIVCPVCKNNKRHYVIRQTSLTAEDTEKIIEPRHPGAGVTHAEFKMVQVRGVFVICRECGVSFWKPDGFVDL